MVQNTGKGGPQVVSDGAESYLRFGKTGEQGVGDVHARFYEAAVRGQLFSTGMTTTSISNVTFTTGTTDATATPVVGVWNPLNSGKNLVILQARLQIVVTATTATGCGAFVWTVARSESAISTGLTPFNMLSLSQAGSVAKGFANTALTGKVNALAVMSGSALMGGQASNASQTPSLVTFGGVTADNIDGGIIVPPGGVLALQCTTTPVAHSAASALIWEEVAV